MSKFRRVAETQNNVGDTVSRAFLAPHQTLEEYDPYAELRAGADERRRVIARELGLIEEEEERSPRDRSWERIAANEQYSRPSMRDLLDEESADRLRNHDLSTKSIRRVGYDTDEGDNARDLQRLAAASVTLDQSLSLLWGNGGSAFGIGGTIFDPEVQEEMLRAAEADNDKFLTAEKRAKAAEAKRAEWEAQKREELGIERARKVVSSRANPILRTGTDSVADGRFGLPDVQAAIERERQLEEMAKRKAERSASIKRDDSYRIDERQERQRRAMQANHLRDMYGADWADNFMRD